MASRASFLRNYFKWALVIFNVVILAWILAVYFGWTTIGTGITGRTFFIVWLVGNIVLATPMFWSRMLD